jgi:ABC-type antimicrobial peptide transport system permease subunit
MAFSVSQRTREMGLRIALGAREGQVARLIVGQGVWPIAVGVVFGVVLSLALGRFVADLLYDTKPGDPLVVTGVCVLLIGAGTIGALVPAWRAMRVNPVVALRAD